MNTEKRRRPRQVSQTYTPLSNFLRSIYEILENPENEHIVSWNEDGLAFVVKNSNAFANEILPNYFKHNKFTSFIRQLNMYGFRKFKRDTGENEFSHDMFKRGHKNLLEQIKRKLTDRTPAPKNKLVSLGKNYDAYKVRKEASTFSAELLSMKNKQNELEKFTKLVYNQNSQLVQENKKIWDEISKNKDKYQRKKEKLTKFIYSMVQQSKDNKALTSLFNKKSLLDGDLDEVQKDLILSQSELDEEKPSKNSSEPNNHHDFSFLNSPKPYQKEESKMSFRNQTIRSRRNSIHADQVPSLEFKPFTINVPAKQSGASKATKKGRSLPFSNHFEEDESEPNIQKQVKLDSRMNNNNLLRSNESKTSYTGRGIGSTHLEQGSFFPGMSRTASLGYPEFEMTPVPMSGIQSLHMDQHDKNFRDKGSFLEFKEDLAKNYYPDTEKIGLITDKKADAEPENWEALIASNNWNDFANNDHKENFFSFD